MTQRTLAVSPAAPSSPPSIARQHMKSAEISVAAIADSQDATSVATKLYWASDDEIPVFYKENTANHKFQSQLEAAEDRINRLNEKEERLLREIRDSNDPVINAAKYNVKMLEEQTKLHHNAQMTDFRELMTDFCQETYAKLAKLEGRETDAAAYYARLNNLNGSPSMALQLQEEAGAVDEKINGRVRTVQERHAALQKKREEWKHFTPPE